MRKLKIVVFSESYFPYMCGVTEAVKNMMENLEKLNHRVSLVVPDYPNHIEKNPCIIRIPSRLADKKRNYYSTKMPISKQVIEKICALRPDILHSHGPYATHLLATIIKKKLSIPLIMTWHTLVEDYIKCWTEEKKLPSIFGSVIAGFFIKYWVVPLCNKTDLILAPTNYIKKLLTSYDIRANIDLLPLAIELNKDKIKNSDDTNLKKKLSIKFNDKVLLYVGRVTPEKNIDKLLGAFREILKTRTDRHLVIVGGGELDKYKTSAYEKFQIPKDKITFIGEVKREDVFSYYKLADLFLFASITDNSPRTILEAMACGVPVVAVNAGGVADLVNDTSSGFLVPNNADISTNLAQKTKEILCSEEILSAMSIKAKKEVFSDKYNPVCYAKKLTEIYHTQIKLYSI